MNNLKTVKPNWVVEDDKLNFIISFNIPYRGRLIHTLI